MAGDSQELLELAINAHGGLKRWQKACRLRIHVRIRGNILMSRFQSPFLRKFKVTVDAHQVYAVIQPFPHQDCLGIFEGDKVRIETENGEEICERSDARIFAGKRFFWDKLDLLYFFGYALWNYAVTPFLFLWSGFSISEIEPITQQGQQLRRLVVIFPPNIPTHCREQIFYFDEIGLLKRLDYTAEIFGKRARGAHLCEQHREFSGLVMPTHRRVVPCLSSGKTLFGPAALEGWIDEVEVFDR